MSSSKSRGRVSKERAASASDLDTDATLLLAAASASSSSSSAAASSSSSSSRGSRGSGKGKSKGTVGGRGDSGADAKTQPVSTLAQASARIPMSLPASATQWKLVIDCPTRESYGAAFFGPGKGNCGFDIALTCVPDASFSHLTPAMQTQEILKLPMMRLDIQIECHGQVVTTGITGGAAYRMVMPIEWDKNSARFKMQILELSETYQSEW